jgi:acetolactate synthase-1/2/3 large subunit
MTRNGATGVVEALVAAGVRHLFSVSGNQILSVYDATIDRPVDIVHTRHEAAAVHMADAWGRCTERPGVALVTAGPGHMNALSALYGALMSESPMVLLSGHCGLAQLGRGGFQEMDQVAAARPVTKAAWVARDPERVGDDVRRALALAVAGRPGPVHVSLPADVLEGAVKGEASDVAPPPHPALSPEGERDALERVIAMLHEAERPLILVGPAMARGARREAARRLSEAIEVPALPVESPRGLNDPWLHEAGALFAEADVVLLLGKRLDYTLRFGEPPGFGRSCRLIQIDMDAGGAAAGLVLTLTADPARAADGLRAAAATRRWRHAAWRERVLAARVTRPSGWTRLRQAATAPMHPLRVCAALQPHLDRGAVLVSDGGEFGQWAQADLEASIRLINGPSGSIGSALPMAIAARLAHPERTVIATLGDGTFGFHAFELDTALRHGLPVVAVVGNDARWNAEYQIQLRQYGVARAVGCALLPSRYDQVAGGLGAHGERVEAPADLDGALARAVASGRPACVDVRIDGVAAPTYGGGH